ncbi:ABC transporter substrate-binding protein [Brucella sp. BE17]|uniref:ABC transporter substrate-binding protein n=1 Tax=Brucella sp. BE17 TaxID=3142977 RepID=UPI0031BAA978
MPLLAADIESAEAAALETFLKKPVAIVDWALVETSLALGVAPIAAVELINYRKLVIEPPLPDGIVDLGLRGSINFELLASLQPEKIYGSNYTAWANDLMRPIAPVVSLPIYMTGKSPYAEAEVATRAMADDYDLSHKADSYIGQTADFIRQSGERIARHRQHPLLIINIGDAKHIRVFGGDSIFGVVAEMMGFSSAWASTSYSATAPISIETLVDYPDAIVIIISPIPPDARRALPQSTLWKAMPAVRDGRVFTLDPINPFGGLPTARRFARLLEEALREWP